MTKNVANRGAVHLSARFMISAEYSLILQNTVPSIIHTRREEKDISISPRGILIEAKAIVSTTKPIERDKRLELEKNSFSSSVRSAPSTAPRIREQMISRMGLTMMAYMFNSPPFKACAIPKDTAKIISPTASSSATIGSRRSVTSPFALYCRTTIKVAAGAVAAAIAPSVMAAERGSVSSPKQKCSPTSARSTSAVAVTA